MDGDGVAYLASAEDPVTLVPAVVFEELLASLDVPAQPSPALACAAALLHAFRS